MRLIIGLARAAAFVMGAGFSLAVGQIGMRMAVQANVRVASASRRSFGDALRIAYRAGTITGMLTDGLGLLGGTSIFIVLGIAAPDALLGFGFGGTLLALFMRVGGGIFTKAADVGADLVGKVEAGIPEDDPRNPAVVADLVGDNVGDCAGMAADIFESYEVTIVSGLILGLALWHLTGRMEWIVFPLVVRGIGVLSSIIGTYVVRGGPGKSGDAMAAIFRGFLSSAAISAVLFFIAGFLYMNTPAMQAWGGWWRTPLAVAVGVLLAILIDRLTEYFTGTHNTPVKEIKRGADTGPATLILQGIAVGYESSVWSVLVIGLHDRGLHRHLRHHPGRGRDRPHDLHPLRRGHDRHRHADADRQQRGHGLVRPDRRQRQRHRRDVVVRPDRPGDQGRAADHGRPGCGGQHDQGHHQGRGHRLGGHRRRLALRLLPGGCRPCPGDARDPGGRAHCRPSASVSTCRASSSAC